MKEKLHIVLPEPAQGDLVDLTKAICDKTGDSGAGGLGGEYGYGSNFENDTFKMHRYCWCDEDNCGYCSGTLPNFLYKPTGAWVKWYKWIGRSEEREGKLPDDWYQKCIESLQEEEKPPLER